MALDPVIRRAAAIGSKQLLVLARHGVKLSALPKQGVDAGNVRTMRILLGIHMGVMFAMYRHPFASHHRGG